jgi:two-component system NarL family sensor kinase
MLQFAVTGLLAVTVLGVAGAALLRAQGRTEAVRDARALTNVLAETIVQPGLTAGLVSGAPSAVSRFDRAVRARLLKRPVVRVKLWSPDGRVVYSDAPGLIGHRFVLAPDELAALRSGTTAAEISDLSKPENRLERGNSSLLEVYRGVRAPGGARLLFEVYVLNSTVTARAGDFWRSLAPVLLGGLLLLWLVQLPLARSLAQRIKRGQRDREALLRQAVAVQEQERRRIARDLHDGPVQELAGVSFAVSAAREHLAADDSALADQMLGEAGASVRESLRDLRGLAVELFPRALREEGLAPALADLLAGLERSSIETSLRADPALRLGGETELSLYRGAQEALRNVVRHAQAASVSVTVAASNGHASVEIVDDGRGFDPAHRPQGHLGLALLEDLASESGGRLSLCSRPGEGTSVLLEVPNR